MNSLGKFGKEVLVRGTCAACGIGLAVLVCTIPLWIRFWDLETEAHVGMELYEFAGGNSMLEFLGTVVTIGIGLWFGQILINWWEQK